LAAFSTFFHICFLVKILSHWSNSELMFSLPIFFYLAAK
jgi:hypothetical protein